jgi:septal ring factor EnvC (AmiA/AmiB activator)
MGALRLLFLLAAFLSVAPAAAADTLEERRRTLMAIASQEDELTAKLHADRAAIARLLGALEVFSRDPPPPLLVSPSDAKDAVRAMILARAVALDLEGKARQLAEEASELTRARRIEAQKSGDLFAAESALEDKQGRLESVASDAALMAPPEARRAALAADALPTPAQLLPPVEGQVATRFGGRLRSGLRAEGLAYRTLAGALVRSPSAAVVAYAGPLKGWGQVVILRAGGGRHMVLSGLGKVSVAAGQLVAAASRLGMMPSDGQTAPELYFEVRAASGPVDPARLVRPAG